MKLSTVVLLISPVRNEGERVHRLLDSLQKQNFEDWRILFYDNASIDNTVDVIRKYAESDSRVHMQLSTDAAHINTNFNRAVNVAFEMFDCQYVGFVGGDDEYEETTYLSDLMKVLEVGNSIATPEFREISELASYERHLCITSIHRSNARNRMELASNTDNVALMYALFQAKDFISIFKNSYSQLTTNMSSDWWFVFAALSLSNTKPQLVTSATYIKYRKGIAFTDWHYTLVEKPLQVNDSAVVKNNYEETYIINDHVQDQNRFLRKAGLAITKIFIAPTKHFWLERNRIRIQDVPEILLLWLIMISSRVISITTRHVMSEN
jgi:glycosyltransferase involved in cell wall biosynthesis